LHGYQIEKSHGHTIGIVRFVAQHRNLT